MPEGRKIYKINSCQRKLKDHSSQDIIATLNRNTLDDKALESDKAGIVWERTKNGYRIVDLTRNKFAEALYFIRDHFFQNEPMCKATNLSLDTTSVKSYIEIVLQKMLDMQSYYAVEEGTNKLVGVVVASVNMKADTMRTETRIRPRQGENLFNIMALKSCVFAKSRLYERLEIDQFFRVHVLCVDPNHQGRGIGTALIRTCLERASILPVPACIAAFSSGPGQTIATNLGFSLLAEITYKNFKMYDEETQSFAYPFINAGIDNCSVACMALRIVVSESSMIPLTSTTTTTQQQRTKNRSKARRKIKNR